VLDELVEGYKSYVIYWWTAVIMPINEWNSTDLWM